MVYAPAGDGIREPGVLALQVLNCVFTKLLLPVSIEDVFACYDLKLIKLDLGDDNGFLIDTAPRGGVVIVNANHHPHRQRFTAGHELYHYLTGERSESQANRFTAALLIPPFAATKIWGELSAAEESNGWAVRLFAARFGVSPQTAKIRLKRLGLL